MARGGGGGKSRCCGDTDGAAFPVGASFPLAAAVPSAAAGRVRGSQSSRERAVQTGPGRIARARMGMRLLGSLNCKLNIDFGNRGSVIKFHISVYPQAPWASFHHRGQAGWLPGTGPTSWRDPAVSALLTWVAGAGGRWGTLGVIFSSLLLHLAQPGHYTVPAYCVCIVTS